MDNSFKYKDFFAEKPNVGYETLLYDCMIGDATLFQRADNIEASWAVVQPAHRRLEGRASRSSTPPAARGRRRADDLLAKDGRRWLPLTEPPARIAPGSIPGTEVACWISAGSVGAAGNASPSHVFAT